MTEELGTVEGISRRDMLKRSAIVGGGAAMVWAAPSVTTFGARAFGSEGTPASDFSNFGAIIVCVEEGQLDKYYKVKGEVLEKEGQTPPDFTWEEPDGPNDNLNLGGCQQYLTGWDTAIPAYGPDLGVSFNVSGSDYVMSIDNDVTTANCTFKVMNGVAASLKQGTCCVPASSITAYEIKWYGPFPNDGDDPRCLGASDA